MERIRQYNQKDLKVLQRISNSLKKKVLEMTTKAGSGHPGGSLSSSDIITSLYFHILKHSPERPDWEERDIFILSKGHCAPIQYAALAECGYFDSCELDSLRKKDSILQGHPDCKKVPGIEVSTGALGTGLSVGCGIACSFKMDGNNRKVFVLLGDGECDEGQIWEAAMFASHYELDNLITFIDLNNYQVDGATKDIMNIEPLDKKFEAFGWDVSVIDGHNIKEILDTVGLFDQKKNKRPKAIIANTIKGKGISFMENENKYHGAPLNHKELEKALTELRTRKESR